MRATRFRSAPRASDPRRALQIRAARFPFEKAGRGGSAIAILYVKFEERTVQATFIAFAAKRASVAVEPLLPILRSPPQ